MDGCKSAAEVELADTLWSFLESDVRGFRVPALAGFSPDEVVGFIEGLHCVGGLLDHMRPKGTRGFDQIETYLMLIEVAARNQLRQQATPAPPATLREGGPRQERADGNSNGNGRTLTPTPR